MKLKPTNEQRRLALRILSEGIQGRPGKFKHDNDPGVYSWAHMILSMALKDLNEYEENGSSSKGRTAVFEIANEGSSPSEPTEVK